MRTLAENIIVANQGSIFLAGPPLVKAALGEEVDSETLGGGAMHARESGVVDHLAISDEHALALARQAVGGFAAAGGNAAAVTSREAPQAEADEPVYDPHELGGVTGTNLKKSWDMREVIARTVDGSRFAEWKREWGETVVTGFGARALSLYSRPDYDVADHAPTPSVHSHSSRPRPPGRHRASLARSRSRSITRACSVADAFVLARRLPTTVSSCRRRRSRRRSSSSCASSAAFRSSSSSTSRASWSALRPRRACVDSDFGHAAERRED